MRMQEPWQRTSRSKDRIPLSLLAFWARDAYALLKNRIVRVLLKRLKLLARIAINSSRLVMPQ